MINLKKQDSIADAVKEILQQEALKGNQHKIDKNKNNKIDAEDFKLLRKEENVDEALKGNQHKIDKNKNNKIDAEDFKLLRKEDTVEENAFDYKSPRQPEPNGGSGVKKGTRYGGSKQKEKPEQEESKEKNESSYFKERLIEKAMLKMAAKKVFKALTGGSDEDQRKDLQRKMGVPQTGQKPTQKEEVEIVYEANIEPTSAKSRSHISNLSNPTVNSVTHQGKQIGLITKQPSGEYHAHHSAAKLAHAKSGTFDTKDKAHQFIRNAHADAIKKGTLSDKFSKANEEVEQIDELSKSTLGSYVKGAARDVGVSRKLSADFENRADKSRNASAKTANSSISKRFNDIAKKRQAGIGQAVERLTKEENELDEVAPPGFEGTVKAMKKYKKIDNPFALAWSMKNKGYKSHKKADGSDK
jgi:hypothetical protein